MGKLDYYLMLSKAIEIKIPDPVQEDYQLICIGKRCCNCNKTVTCHKVIGYKVCSNWSGNEDAFTDIHNLINHFNDWYYEKGFYIQNHKHQYSSTENNHKQYYNRTFKMLWLGYTMHAEYNKIWDNNIKMWVDENIKPFWLTT